MLVAQLVEAVLNAHLLLQHAEHIAVNNLLVAVRRDQQRAVVAAGGRGRGGGVAAGQEARIVLQAEPLAAHRNDELIPRGGDLCDLLLEALALLGPSGVPAAPAEARVEAGPARGGDGGGGPAAARLLANGRQQVLEPLHLLRRGVDLSLRGRVVSLGRLELGRLGLLLRAELLKLRLHLLLIAADLVLKARLLVREGILIGAELHELVVERCPLLHRRLQLALKALLPGHRLVELALEGLGGALDAGVDLPLNVLVGGDRGAPCLVGLDEALEIKLNLAQLPPIVGAVVVPVGRHLIPDRDELLAGEDAFDEVSGDSLKLLRVRHL